MIPGGRGCGLRGSALKTVSRDQSEVRSSKCLPDNREDTEEANDEELHVDVFVLNVMGI